MHTMIRILQFLFAAGATIAQNTTDPKYIQLRSKQNAMMKDITCRWSGCDEQCPIGFVSVPRQGSKGEMMVDHTVCGNNKISRLCCPSNQIQPTCQWRGISRSGNCKPGCPEGEVEVWSLRLGCNSGHQSACCTTSTPSTEAYDHCRWEGKAPDCWGTGAFQPAKPCSKDFPLKIVETKAGFGGQEECRTGRTSYCCRDLGVRFPPPAFQNCKWASEMQDLMVHHGVCDAACPPNFIKIAAHAGVCVSSGLQEAYCCQGVKPSDMPGYRPPRLSAQAFEFAQALNRYLFAYQAKQCPLPLMPTWRSWFKEGNEDDETEHLKGETTAFVDRPMLEACDEWKHVWPELAFLMYIPKNRWSDSQIQMQMTWDELVPPQYPRTSVADLADFHHMYPLAEPEPVLEGMLSDLDGWGSLRDDLDHLNSTVCVDVVAGYYPAHPRYHGQAYGSTNSSDHLQRRSIQPDMHGDSHSLAFLDPMDRIPSLGTIFDGVRIGALTLHYARWLYFNRHNGEPSGPLLELAYWIGTRPGVVDNHPDLDVYRDMRTTGRNGPQVPDRWVVFHFHFDETRDIFFDIDGRTYAGFTSMSVYHGQDAIDSRHDANQQGWGVNWRGGRRDGRTARTIIRCPWDSSERSGPHNAVVTRMLVGHNSNDPPNPIRSIQGFRDFLERLYRQGYLGAPAFLPLMNNPAYPSRLTQYGEMSTNNNHELRHDVDGTGPVNPNDIWESPYQINFRITNYNPQNYHSMYGATYDYNIPYPNMRPLPPNTPYPLYPPPPGSPPAKSDSELSNVTDDSSEGTDMADQLKNLTLSASS
ncbi:hypothetical protein BDU57DRAFT_523336 [Ampelomyces quisqualis]|uniref:Uncharacterized protein n=1 Tax=Ampelomyces quisqualis TaxID=50730 RepID=A0A6A5QBY9_AMPQU|nr:hypothetical protein BDU57DRAFT_523336 [Ampelomyces quisqualis]